ncbi:GNAT family N-acetyltransferase [Granulosicoccus sp. 3-233]|uniref:GNAT family N-acetyltransferase n=1 Tax=Granulosicoccus sp. 3-233 TaxID=3417969 RepID=UPI003D33AA1F
MDWHFRRFDTLDSASLFALMKLRVDVFVVEQNCAYPELDDHDNAAGTWHLLGLSNDTLAAYARAMPDQVIARTLRDRLANTTSTIDDRHMVRIGRVVVAPAFRGQALGRALMQRMISHLDREHPRQVQFLAAQTGACSLYESLGFIPVSDRYLEDGIAHVDMMRLPASTSR